MSRPAAVPAASAVLPVAGGGRSPPALAKDYLLTAAKPDQLVLVDPAARKVEKTCTVPDAGTGVLTIVPSPDASTAYMITNHWESVSGIDLDSCEQVFRADFSSGDERVKATFGMDISPDGSELFVIQSPVRLLPGEYQVQPTRIAVYDTAAGVGAEPIRTLRGAAAHGGADAVERRLQAVCDELGHLRARPADRRGDRAPSAAHLAARELQRAGRARRVAAVGRDRHLLDPYFAMRTDLDPGRLPAPTRPGS